MSNMSVKGESNQHRGFRAFRVGSATIIYSMVRDCDEKELSTPHPSTIDVERNVSCILWVGARLGFGVKYPYGFSRPIQIFFVHPHHTNIMMTIMKLIRFVILLPTLARAFIPVHVASKSFRCDDFSKNKVSALHAQHDGACSLDRGGGGNQQWKLPFLSAMTAAVLTVAATPAFAVSGGGLDYAGTDISGQNFSKGNYKGKDFSQGEATLTVESSTISRSTVCRNTHFLFCFLFSDCQGDRFFRKQLTRMSFLQSCTYLEYLVAMQPLNRPSLGKL